MYAHTHTYGKLIMSEWLDVYLIYCFFWCFSVVCKFSETTSYYYPKLGNLKIEYGGVGSHKLHKKINSQLLKTLFHR